jgi:hypothetical protein
MRPTSWLAALSVCVAVLLVPLAHAGDGHDHGPAAPAPNGQALPRFAAASELFELVGVLDGRRLTLYLDRAADNTPVTGARIELDIAGTKLQAEPHDDSYDVMLAAEPKPGVLPITATVTAGQEVDLLAGELDLHEDAAPSAARLARPWMQVAGWAAAGAVALAGLAMLARRRTRRQGTGAAA